MIKNKIKNPNIIRILNNIFTPINKEDGSMDIDLSVKTYENIMITDIVDTKNSIIYNDEIILYDWFVNNLINKKITNYNLIIIESTIKYTWGTISNETFSKTDI